MRKLRSLAKRRKRLENLRLRFCYLAVITFELEILERCKFDAVRVCRPCLNCVHLSTAYSWHALTDLLTRIANYSVICSVVI